MSISFSNLNLSRGWIIFSDAPLNRKCSITEKNQFIMTWYGIKRHIKNNSWLVRWNYHSDWKKWSRVRFCEQVSNEDKLNLILRHTYSLILAEESFCTNIFCLVFFLLSIAWMRRQIIAESQLTSQRANGSTYVFASVKRKRKRKIEVRASLPENVWKLIKVCTNSPSEKNRKRELTKIRVL